MSRVIRFRGAPGDGPDVDGMHPVAAAAVRAIAGGATGCVILFVTDGDFGWDCTDDITQKDGHWLASQYAAACLAAAAADDDEED